MAFRLKNSSLWYCDVREAGTGRKLRLSAPTEAEAEALALEYRAAKKRGAAPKPPVSGDLTCDDLLIRYLSTLPPSTARNEAYVLKAVASASIGHIPAKNVTEKDLKSLIVLYREKGMRQNTIKRRMGTVMAALRWAEREGFVSRVPRLRIMAGDDAIIQPPTLAELETIISASPPHLVRAIVLSAATGVRAGKSELLALTWADVDFRAATIRVLSAKKGGIPWRAIPIAHSFVPILADWHAQDGNDNGPIVRYRGKAVGDIKKSWAASKGRAGITRRLRMYDIRHQFVTALISGGTDPATAAYLAGHADPRTTMRVYRHVQTKDTRRAMGNILLPGLPITRDNTGNA